MDRETEEKLFIAKFAAGVAGDMNQIDSTRDSQPTGSVKKRLRPEQFLSGIKNIPREVLQKAIAPAPVPQPGDIVPMPTEADLVIQPEDEELKKLMAQYEEPKTIPAAPLPQQDNSQQFPSGGIIPSDIPIGPATLKPIAMPTNVASPEMNELRKAFNYIKRKVKVMEKNQQRILEILEKLEKR